MRYGTARRLLPAFLAIPLLVAGEPSATEAPPAQAAKEVVHDEHTVYVPYDDLGRIFEKQGRGVFLPYAEFVKLWQKARPVKAPEPRPEPPFEAAVAASRYEGTIEGDAATITAVYTLEMLKDEGWCKLPLPLKDVAVTESSIQGGKAFLNTTDEGYVVALGAPGVYTLTLKFAAHIERQPGQSSFSFGCPKAAVSQIQMTLPGRGLEVHVEPLLVASTTPTGDSQNTVVQAFLGATDKVTFRWSTKTVEKTPEEALLFVKTHLRASVREGSVRADATLNYEILRAPTDRFEVAVQTQARVLGVGGANLREWNVREEGGRKIVRAELHTPEKKAYQLTVSIERQVDALPAQVEVPSVIPLRAAREVGYLAIARSGHLDIRAAQHSRVSQLAAEDLPLPLRAGDTCFAASYVSHPWRVVLDVSKIVPKLTAEVLTTVTVGRETAVVRSSLNVRVRKAGIFRLRFRIPEGALVRTIGSDRTVEDFSEEVQDGVRTVTVALAGRAEGDLSLPIHCEEIRPEETGKYAVPIPEILDAERQQGAVCIALDETLEAKVRALSGLTAAGIEEVLGRIGTSPDKDTRPVLGFQYMRSPVSLDLGIERRKPQVTVRVDSAIKVEEDAIKLRAGLFYTVKYAGITELSFLVPAQLGDDLRITGQNIKEKTRERQEARDGVPAHDSWRVTLQGETLGEYRLQLEYETKLEGLQRDDEAAFEVPEITVAGVARENGYLAITRGPNLEVGSTTEGLEALDTRELAGTSLGSSGAFLAFKYLYHPYRLRLRIAQHEYLAVLHSVVNEMHLESEFSKEGGVRTQADLMIQNNQRPVIPVQLPGRARICSLSVGGRPERPRKGEQGQLLIPVAKVEPGEPFLVRLVYEADGEREGMDTVGALSASAPSFPAEIPVLRLLWDVYAPAGYEYLWSGGNMEAVETRIRGWEVIREAARYLTPRLAQRFTPRQSRQRAAGSPGRSPQGESASGAISVDLVRQGLHLQFSRLSGDGRIWLPYLESKVYTAIDMLMLLSTVVVGVWWSRRRSKAKFVLGLGLGAVLLASFFPARIAGWIDSVFLGAAILGVVWFLAAVWRRVRAVLVPWSRFLQWAKRQARVGLAERAPGIRHAREQDGSRGEHGTGDEMRQQRGDEGASGRDPSEPQEGGPGNGK